MAIELYFGLPGSGKTSLLVEMAVTEAYKIKMGISPYEKVITNVPIQCEGVLYSEDFAWFGDYYVENALFLIDEATIEFDSRNYKAFTKGLTKGFVLHRHMKIDIKLFLQCWDRYDKTIRTITDRVFYVHKGVLCKGISYCNRIPYGILWPDESSDKYGDIVQGYRKCPFYLRLFSKRLYRKFVYGYYDTFWLPDDIKPLPKGKLKDLTQKAVD